MCKDTSLAAQWFSIHVYRCTLRVCSKINPTTGNCLTVSFPKFHAQTCTIDRRFGTEPKLVARETNEAWARTAEGAQEIATRHSAVEWCVCVYTKQDNNNNKRPITSEVGSGSSCISRLGACIRNGRRFSFHCTSGIFV